MNSRAAFWSLLIFGGARVLGWLRVSEELELKGMDIDKHGEAAYPAQVMFRVSNASAMASPVVLSQLKQLTIKTYNLGNSKMCFTIFAASLLILKNLSRLQFKTTKSSKC